MRSQAASLALYNKGYMDTETQQEVKKVETLLGEIKTNTADRPAKNFMKGVWQGAGIVAGTLLAVLILGWVLTIMGVIPGADVIAERISDTLRNRY